MGVVKNGGGLLVMRPQNLLYLKNEYMNCADYLNADSDAIVPGLTDILHFVFKMPGIHCSYSSCYSGIVYFIKPIDRL